MTTISAILLVSANQKYELKQSLLSVQSQTRRADEIVIIDSSGSTENHEFVKDLLCGNEKYISLRNLEMRDACGFTLFGIGSKNSFGEYLAFLKAGDTWDGKKLESVDQVLVADGSLDLVIHSCAWRVSVNDETVLIKDISELPLSSIFYTLFSFSSSVIRRNIFFAMDQFSVAELEKLKVFALDKSLCLQVNGAQKDRMQAERCFWNDNYRWIKKMGLLLPAALFCIRLFQKSIPAQDSYKDFAGNTGLSPEDCIEVLFGRSDFTRVIIRGESQASPQAERKQRFYNFIKNWLSFRIAGGNVPERLRTMGISRVAVYGAGNHGMLLHGELHGSGIEIVFWLDASPKAESLLGIPVILPSAEGMADRVDAVIVTPFLEFAAISGVLRQSGYTRIISIEDVTK